MSEQSETIKNVSIYNILSDWMTNQTKRVLGASRTPTVESMAGSGRYIRPRPSLADGIAPQIPPISSPAPVASAETSITLRLRPRINALEKVLIGADAEGKYGDLGSQIRMDWGSIYVNGDQRNQVPEFESVVRHVFEERGYTVISVRTDGFPVNELTIAAPVTLSLTAENANTKLVNRKAKGSPCKYFVTSSLTVTYYPDNDTTSIRGDATIWPSAIN
ncbi:hypothetical protein AUJ13_02875 [Candidatus Micrarchaeota archaeon CG1_02_49_24]|nr:MAG: hypothetical protein AUJ13_02875 [Candidatus Micrarchaeota archaeon CG1_02_49_24]